MTTRPSLEGRPPHNEEPMAVNTKGGMPVLGLDIGAAYIKAVEMKPGKGGLAITGVGILPTPPGCIVNDEIVDPLVLAAAIKQLLAENNIKTRRVISSVAGQNTVVVRVIDVPKMTEKELSETMRWEIDRHIPFSPEEVVKDYSPITRANEDPNAPNMAVLLAVAQNSLIAGHMQAILQAGLTPVAIEVETLSSARALMDVDDAFSTENVVMINMGHTKTDVSIFESGTLSFPRTIPVAGAAITEAVAGRLNIDIADAERLKKQHGEVPADAQKRFGSGSTPPEETFSFGDFGTAEPAAPTPDAGGFSLGAPAFAPTADGPVFGETTEGPLFPGVPEPVVEAPESVEFPSFTPGFEAPEPPPATAEPFFAPEPEFQVPVPGVPGDSTPTVTAPEESVALTPDEPRLESPVVPDVISEADRNRREISDAFMPVVSEIATEIKRSIEYYETRTTGTNRVDRAVLFGGSANLPGLREFLELELGIPVQASGVPQHLSLDTGSVPNVYLAEVSSMLPVAMGLASREAVLSEPVLSKKAA